MKTMRVKIKTDGSWKGKLEVSVNGKLDYSTTSNYSKNITYNRPLEKNDTVAVNSKDVNGNLNIEIKIEGSDKL